jgi:hypothetical protein
MMDYIKRNLINKVDNYILEGCQSYSNLPESYKHDLVAAYIDTMGRHAYECIVESDDLDDVAHRLRQFIFAGSTAHAFELAETMRDNAEKYLSRQLQELYSERSSTLESERKQNARLIPYQHKDNGETAWIRA